MISRRRKGKAMAPQTETVVELPERVDVPSRSELAPGEWTFPSHWTDEEINDWLITHPTTPPAVETLNVDPEISQHFDDCDPECDGDRRAELGTENDGGESGDAGNPSITEEDEIAFLKAHGTYAAAMAVPLDLQDEINTSNYDPRQFFLVHLDVWNEMVDATVEEAELSAENKELRKRVNALTRGMRKVNKHWSATKRLLKLEERQHVQDVEYFNDLLQEQTKKQTVFVTRLARRLRKARAGRDKRERQLNQANQVIKGQGLIIQRQDEYIGHLERLLNGTTQL